MGFMSAQFVIPSGIDNALQIIQRILITTTGTSTGDVVMDINTWTSNIYVNPNFLDITTPYSGQYILTLDTDGYLSFTSGSIGWNTISGAYLSGNDLILSFSDSSIINVWSVVWNQGPIGPQGNTGAVWPQGQTGVTGIHWQDGLTTLFTSEPLSPGGLCPNWWISVFFGLDDNMDGILAMPSEVDWSFDLCHGADGTGWSWSPQTLSLNNNDLSISDWNTVDLSSLGFWSLQGNTTTNPSINFLGTIDSQDLVFRTNNTERMRITGNSWYVGIGTGTVPYPLTVHGWFGVIDDEVSQIATSNFHLVPWYKIAWQTIDAEASSWILGRMMIYDDRWLWWSDIWINIATEWNLWNPQWHDSAFMTSKNGENIDLNVVSNIIEAGWTITAAARWSIDIDPGTIQIKAETWLTVIWNNTSSLHRADITINPYYITIFGSGGVSNMIFNSISWLFGYGTWNPWNIIDIASNSVWNPNTLGLRFSNSVWTSHPNRVIWLDANWDLIPLANIGTLGGWGSMSYWTQMGNDLYPSTLSNNIAIGQNSTTEKLWVSGSFLVENNVFTLWNTDTLFGWDPAVWLQWFTGNQEYRIWINDDGNGFFTNEMSYANMSTNTYANFGINPNFWVRMNRWDDITTFPNGRSSLAVDSNGIEAIGKSTGNDTNMVWYNDSFDTLMRLTNDGYLGVWQASPSHILTVSGDMFVNDGTSLLTLWDNLLGYWFPWVIWQYEEVWTWSSFFGSFNPWISPVWDNNVWFFAGFLGNNPQNDRTIIHTTDWKIEMSIVYNNIKESEIDLQTDSFEVKSSGGINNNLHIDFLTNNIGVLTNNPINTLDISQATVTNTLWLRFSHPYATSNSWRVVWLNANGDLIALADISTLGWGGSSPSPWQEWGGWIWSVQVIGNGTTNAQWAFSLAWWLWNDALWAFSVVVWWSGNLAIDNWDIVIGGLWNRTIGTFSNPSFPISWINFIGWWINNSIQSWALSNIIGWIENIISNAVLSFIGWGSNNQNYANVGVIVWWSDNTWYGNNTFIGWGDGNFLSWDQSSLIWGRWNFSDGNTSFLWWGNENELYWDSSFLGGWSRNTIDNANDSVNVWWNQNTVDGANLSVIVWGWAGFVDLSSFGIPAMNLDWNNTNTDWSFIWWGWGNVIVQTITTGIAEFIWWGLMNLLEDSLGSIIVWWLWNNIINTPFSFIWWGLANLIEDWSLNFVLGWENNSIFGGWSDNIIVAWSTNLIRWDGLAFLNFIWWGEGNQIRQQTPWSPLDYNNIVGGEDNQILDSFLSNIVWGVRNRIIQSSQNAFIWWGGDNTLEWVTDSSILWWDNNQIIRIGYASIVWWSNNTILSDYGFIAWWINNTLWWYGASILWGLGNATSGYVATVLWWENNLANGDYSLVWWLNAQALDNNSFVRSDWSAITNTTATNQVVMRARGWYRLFSDSSNIFWVSLAPGTSSWGSVSDRNAKENIVEIDQQSILDKFMQLPLFAWNYKWDPRQILHYGPMAQDFNKLFSHGDKDLTLSTQEIDGVMFVAIQALGEKVQQQEQRITELEKLVQSLLDK